MPYISILIFAFLLREVSSQTPIPSATPAYCTTAPTSVYSPTYRQFAPTPRVTPPIPCPGAYAIQNGVCCSNGFDCLNPGNNTCTCVGGPLLWSMPLEPCVTQNPYYSGCPGNMLRGLCCSGPGECCCFSGAACCLTLLQRHIRGVRLQWDRELGRMQLLYCGLQCDDGCKWAGYNDNFASRNQLYQPYLWHLPALY